MTLQEIYQTILEISMGIETASLKEIRELYEQANNYYEKETGKRCNLKNEKKKLFQWVQERARYPLLTDCMQDMAYNMFYYQPERDGKDMKDLKFFLNHFDLFLDWMEEYKKEYSHVEYSEEKAVPISPLSKQQLFQYVEEILLEVDPSRGFLKLFYEAIKDEKIIFWKDLNKREKNIWRKELEFEEEYPIFEKTDGNNLEEYIVITLYGTTEDVGNLIHEFAHYISAYKEKKQTVSLLVEYPSIFYELYTADFLERKGYSKEEVNYLLNIRIEDTLNQIESIYPFIRYLDIFLNHGEITEELDRNTPYMEEEADRIHMCDMCTESIMEANPLESVFYFIGTYLSLKELKRHQNGEVVLPKLKKQTQKLEQLPLNRFFEKEIEKNKIKRKKNLA